jgi:hypothetical protein
MIWSLLVLADPCRLRERRVYFMLMKDQKPEKSLKNLRLRNEVLDSLIPYGAEHVFRRPKPDVCWIEDGQIDLLESPFLDVFPLVDPHLFLSFLRLGARRGGEYKDPSESRIKKWVEKYGLPAKRLQPGAQRSTSEKVTDLYVETLSMSVEQFRREVRDAWELWTIHKEVWAEDAEAIMDRVRTPRSRWDRDLAEGFDSRDHKDRRTVARALYKPPGTAEIGTAQAVLDEIATAQIADVRPRVYSSDLSWWCPDLLSAMYLQFALLRMGDRPKRICANCGTLFPLTRKDKDYCDETCYRTAYNHRSNNTI